MKQVKYYGIPVLMILVASFQLMNVNDGLTRWKGGGFGMYSEQYHSSRQLVIEHTFINPDSLKRGGNLRKAYFSYLHYPRSKFANILAKELDFKKDTLQFEIWQTNFDSNNLTISKTKIHSFNLYKEDK